MKQNIKYVYENQKPVGKPELLAESFACCLISGLGGVTWQDTVNLIYKRSVELSYRPYDIPVINSLVKDLGFVKLTMRSDSMQELLTQLYLTDNPDLLVLFQLYSTGYVGGRMAIGWRTNGIFEIHGVDNPAEGRIIAVWTASWPVVRKQFSELLCNSDVQEKRKNARKAAYKPKETEYFSYFQPNPKQRNIGDCVTRALCGCLEQDWETVMSMLNKSLNGNLDFNYWCNFMNVLLDENFERHPVPNKNGKNVDGIGLCEWMKEKWPNGQCRGFAFVGSSHVAAVRSYELNGKISYYYRDSWDSTRKRVTDLFIKVDTVEEDTPATLPELVPIDHLEIGSRIVHPQFGIGTVTKLTPFQSDCIISISFDSGSQKNLMQSWVIENCKADP